MLARIILRKGFGREPTRKEVKALREKLDSKSVTLPSLDTIIAAFENGEEVCPFFSPSYPYCATQPVYVATESVSVEAPMPRLRREFTVGDCHHIPGP